MNTHMKPLVIAMALATQQAYGACDTPYSVTKSSMDTADTSTLAGALTHMADNCSSEAVLITISDSIAGETLYMGESTFYAYAGVSLTVRGPAANPVTLQRNASNTMFSSNESGSIALENLILDGGNLATTSPLVVADQGATALTLNNVTIRNTAAGGVASTVKGAAINVDGAATSITDGTFSNNTAGAAGGAIYVEDANLTIVDSTFTSNAVQNDQGNAIGGGAVAFAGVDSSDHNLTINNTSFSENSTQHAGGALYIKNAGVVTLAENTFTTNQASNWSGGNADNAKGGAIYLDNFDSATMSGDQLTSNVAKHQGGALYISDTDADSTLTIVDTVMSSNRADSTLVEAVNSDGHGGALYLAASTAKVNVTATDSTFSANSAQSGGAALLTGNHTLKFERSLIKDSSANYGGAIWLKGNYNSSTPDLQVLNSTITTTESNSGAIAVSGTHGDDTWIKHSTLTSNYAGVTGGSALYGGGVSSGSAIEISHSIISGNSGGDGALCQLGEANFQFAIDHSLVSDASLTTNCRALLDNGGNQLGTTESPIDPLLGSLADNGGATLSYRPVTNSPAVNAGDANIVDAPNTDQRGSARVVSVIDLGSVELGNNLPTFTGLENYETEVDEQVSWDVDKATDMDDDVLTYSVTGLPNGLSFNENLGSVVGKITAAAYQTSASYTITITAHDWCCSVSEERTLTFTNNAPVLPAFGNVRYAVGDEVTIEYQLATDDDGVQLQYTVTGLPEGISYKNGSISGVITEEMKVQSPYTITITANDGYDTAEQSFQLSIGTDSKKDDGFLGLGSLSYPFMAVMGLLGWRRKRS